MKCRNVEPNIVFKKNVEDFISDNTRRFFTILGISSRFLIKNVDNWEEDEDNKINKNIVFNEGCQRF